MSNKWPLSSKSTDSQRTAHARSPPTQEAWIMRGREVFLDSLSGSNNRLENDSRITYWLPHTYILNFVSLREACDCTFTEKKKRHTFSPCRFSLWKGNILKKTKWCYSESPDYRYFDFLWNSWENADLNKLEGNENHFLRVVKNLF